VEDDEFAVPGALDVVLDPDGADPGGLVDGGQGVLGGVGGAGPVGDDRGRRAVLDGPDVGCRKQEGGGPQERGGRAVTARACIRTPRVERSRTAPL
jgi:hypothetical protein